MQSMGSKRVGHDLATEHPPPPPPLKCVKLKKEDCPKDTEKEKPPSGMPWQSSG